MRRVGIVQGGGRACGWARDRALAGACRANVGAALAHALRELRGARCPGVRCLPAGYGAHQSGARLHAMRSSVWEPALYGMPRGRGRARPVSCRRGVRWASRTYRPCVQGRGRTAAIHRNRVHHAPCRARGRAHGARTVRRASFAGGRGDVRPRDLIGIPTPRIRPHGGYRLRFCGCELPAAHRCPGETRLTRPARIGARRKTCSLTRAIRGGRSGWWYAGPAAGRRHYHGRHHERRRPRAQMRRSRACRLPCIRPRVVMCKNAPVPFYTPLATCGIMPRSSFQAVVAGARERKTPCAP